MLRHARLRVLLVAFAVLDALVASGPASAADRLRVVTTTVQITALTTAVAGDLADVRGLVPPGADPHEFEPVASDLTAVENAQLILRHGVGLDDWLDRTLKAGKRAAVVTVTRGIRLQKAEENGRPVDDPHVWHDPANAKRMVDNIAAALDRADPAHKTSHDANAIATKARLDAAAAQVWTILSEIPPANRKLVTNHDAFGYFAKAYGLKIIGAVIPSVSTQAEPSAGETAALLDTIKRERVKAIFAESSVDPKLAETLAREAGVTVVTNLYGDSLGAPGSGADTVEGMWIANARAIAAALK